MILPRNLTNFIEQTWK